MSPSNLTILAYEETPLGPICLRRRELLSAPGTVVTEVTLNHQFLMSSLHNDSERALARVALKMHSGTDMRVLVGGLGLGYTAQAALDSDRVKRVEAVEFLPEVIDWLGQELFPLAAGLNADPRFSTVRGDVYERLLTPPSERWDLILIDVDHAPDDRLDEASGRFYTEEGLRLASRHLAPGGVLGVWSYAESSPFARALEATFEDVHLERVTFYVDMVEEERTDWLFFARSPDLPGVTGT